MAFTFDAFILIHFDFILLFSISVFSIIPIASAVVFRQVIKSFSLITRRFIFQLLITFHFLCYFLLKMLEKMLMVHNWMKIGLFVFAFTLREEFL